MISIINVGTAFLFYIGKNKGCLKWQILKWEVSAPRFHFLFIFSGALQFQSPNGLRRAWSASAGDPTGPEHSLHSTYRQFTRHPSVKHNTKWKDDTNSSLPPFNGKFDDVIPNWHFYYNRHDVLVKKYMTKVIELQQETILQMIINFLKWIFFSFSCWRKLKDDDWASQ